MNPMAVARVALQVPVAGGRMQRRAAGPPTGSGARPSSRRCRRSPPPSSVCSDPRRAPAGAASPRRRWHRRRARTRSPRSHRRRNCPRVSGVPDLFPQARIRIGALVEQLRAYRGTTSSAAGTRGAADIGLRRPLAVQHRIERRHAVLRGEIGVGALLEQVHRQVEVAVDDRDHQRAGLDACAHLIDVGAALEERLHALDAPAAPRNAMRVKPPCAATSSWYS